MFIDTDCVKYSILLDPGKLRWPK